MGSEAWRQLAVWELRRSLRRRAFWAMVAVAVGVPLLCGRAELTARRGFDPALLAGPQALLVTLLSSAWLLLAVKRQFGRTVSDDWLLVIPFRQALLAQLVAGAVLSLVLASASVLVGWVAQARTGQLDGFVLLGGLVVLLSVVQPLALVARLATASDFLMAAPAAVGALGLCMALAWALLPGAGFVWLAAVVADGDRFDPVSLWLLLALPFNLFALRSGLRRARAMGELVTGEWALKLALQRLVGVAGAAGVGGPPRPRPTGPVDDNAGALRAVAGDQSTPRRRAERTAAAACRAWLQRRGVATPLAYDLARYPALPLRWFFWGDDRRRRRLGWVLGGALAAAGLAVAIVDDALGGVAVALLTCGLVRALASGVEIVRGEREQGTLDSLALTPTPFVRVLDRKLLVVLAQTLPLLAPALLLGYLLECDSYWTYAELTLAHAVALTSAGMAAASSSRSRIGALVLGCLLVLGCYLAMAVACCVAVNLGVLGCLETPTERLLETLLLLVVVPAVYFASLRTRAAERLTQLAALGAG